MRIFEMKHAATRKLLMQLVQSGFPRRIRQPINDRELRSHPT
jgi:hypothetical protein